VTLIARDDLIGVFYLGSNKVDAYSQRHVALAERIGRQIAGTVAVAHLYAESVQMRSNMEASRARFAGILDIAADAVISVDQMQQITLFNQGAEQIFGYSAREVIGQPLNCLIPERSRTVHSQLLTQFIDDPDSSRMMGERREVFGLRKGDIEFPAEASISKMEFDGDVVLTVMMRDIKHRKRAEEALTASNERLMSVLDNLRDAQKQLVQQERLSALGTMASGIAHDFNNALTPILGYTDMLLNRPVLLDDRDKLTRYLQETNTAARDASEVVSRMREFYRHREDVDLMGAADLNKVVEEAVGVTQHRWKDMTQSTGVDIDIGTELSEDLPFVAGNEASLRSALTNLILNAVDAMPVGGTLTISTRSAEESVELRVSDTGTGMTEDVRRRAMEPFFTTKAEGGSGLGLAMVHGIVERHGGQIDIQSELGKGTTFVVKLPTTTALGETATPSDDTQAVRGRHVLVVDDEEFILNLVTEYLGASGNSVETATNGWEALEMFKAGKFDVVITDRGMPGMNGDQLAIAIKELASDIPVIMVTGVGEVMAVTNETPAGVDLVVNKPVTESDLQKAMSQVLGEES
jgi:PAS domain S-box-containing protein